MSTRSMSGAITQILRNILRHVVSTRDLIFYRPQRAEPEFLLIIRPINIAGINQLLRMDTRDKSGGSLSRQAGEEAVNVPGPILVRLRNKEILYLRIILLTHIPDKLGNTIAESEQIIPVTFCAVLRSSKEIVPLVTESELHNHRPGTRVCRLQLFIMVGILLMVTERHHRSIGVAELDKLIQAVTILFHSVIRTSNLVKSHEYQHLPGKR